MTFLSYIFRPLLSSYIFHIYVGLYGSLLEKRRSVGTNDDDDTSEEVNTSNF